MLVALPLFALGAVPTLAAALGLAVIAGTGMVVGEVLSETALPRMLDDDGARPGLRVVFPAAVERDRRRLAGRRPAGRRCSA